MSDPFATVVEALTAAQAAWARADAPGVGDDGFSGAALTQLNSAVARLRRQVDAVHAQVAARVAWASRPELGNAGLARKEGFRTPASLIAAATGTTPGAAAKLVAVGQATEPRLTLTGQEAPPRHPAVAQALTEGQISVEASAAIIGMLDRVALRAGREAIEQAEQTLVQQAVGLSLDQLAKILQRAEAWLDPDGVEPREEDLRAQRSVHVREDRNGLVHITAKLDPETAAPVKTAIDALVGSELRRRDDARDNASDDARDIARDPARTGARKNARGGADADADRRSITQLQADALATICRHVLGCERSDVPTAGATVVVRVSAQDLESGLGHATIDGLNQPISIATARRMAAGGGIIPCVLGTDSEILDFGRAKRLFTPAQKLALIERDGGCAMCGAPPGWTQVHHLLWWTRDAGPTDLNNGMLLCVRCHHRIHDDGWEIRIEGKGVRARVWFVPPRHVDPARVPRPGGRARFDYLAG